MRHLQVTFPIIYPSTRRKSVETHETHLGTTRCAAIADHSRLGSVASTTSFRWTSQRKKTVWTSGPVNVAGTEPSGLWRKEIFLELWHAANFQFFLSFQKRPRGSWKPASELADWRRETQKNTTVSFNRKYVIIKVMTDQKFSKQLHIHNTSYSPIFYPPFYPKDLHSCHYCKHTKISFWVFPTSGCLWNSGKCESLQEAEPCGKKRAADSSTVFLWVDTSWKKKRHETPSGTKPPLTPNTRNPDFDLFNAKTIVFHHILQTEIIILQQTSANCKLVGWLNRAPGNHELLHDGPQKQPVTLDLQVKASDPWVPNDVHRCITQESQLPPKKNRDVDTLQRASERKDVFFQNNLQFVRLNFMELFLWETHLCNRLTPVSIDHIWCDNDLQSLSSSSTHQS